ncbi:sugar MFS transporter [Brevundimonas sp. SORGH_AS_0993]|uniref:sugar MFS transporter n=1 Tax=Brevundimonas sp. SORGH_AS_0993 TaxID=3041794 RepID=UPI00278487D7|nr:sugar MFS transporter [Brevundimonas sp. SORGH_AS_0993]MDQ1155442.1 FHS family L-fucose permease-like MFS transporter [Brevundimonas sp. SORGH_AS_0993]
MTVPDAGKRQGAGLAFAYVTTLFFAWGFVTSLIDPLIAAVKRVFDLSLAEAMLTASAWFIAYGLASLPAAWVLSRFGYSRSIILALSTMVVGCLIVPVATIVDIYGLVLLALFVIASGVTLLQVAANPLSASLGAPKTAHLRLTFSQAFNSLGATLGPVIGSTVLLTGGVFAADAVINASTRGESLRSIDFAFLAVGAFFAIVAIFIWTARKQIDNAVQAQPSVGVVSPFSAFKSRWAVFGALAIFFYVGAEVTIGTLLIPFISSGEGLGVAAHEAGHMVGWYYWGAAMVGRFVGSALLTRVRAPILLTVCTVTAAALALVVTQSQGSTAAYAALAIGFFNSIMFPTIFTLTLERSSAKPSATSGLLIFGIIGGAVLPPIAGRVADNLGAITPAFFVPLAGYLVLICFAVACARTKAKADVAATVAH